MAEIIRFQGNGAAGAITDIDVENLITVQNRIDRNRDLHEQMAESIMARLRDGAEIAAGSHDVELRHETVNGIREEQLVINRVIRYRRLAGPAHRLNPRSAAALDP